jgi:diacylglycerol kinase (ATP)
MQRKIIYIINPVAGTKDKGQLRQLIEDKTTRAGIPYRVYASVTNGDYSFYFR